LEGLTFRVYQVIFCDIGYLGRWWWLPPPRFSVWFKISYRVLYCIALYLYIYTALLDVHTNQKRFQGERPREKRAL